MANYDKLYPLWATSLRSNVGDLDSIHLVLDRNPTTLTDSPPITSNGSTPTGWVVASGTIAPGAGQVSQMDPQTIRGVNSFGSGIVPPPVSASSMGWAINGPPEPITRSYAAGIWPFRFQVTARTAAWNGRHRHLFRIFKGSNVDGSNAVELTTSYTVSTTLAGSTVTSPFIFTAPSTSNVTLDTTRYLEGFWHAPAISLTNQYLFITSALEITSPGTTINGGRHLYLTQGEHHFLTTPDRVDVSTGIIYRCGMIGT